MNKIVDLVIYIICNSYYIRLTISYIIEILLIIILFLECVFLALKHRLLGIIFLLCFGLPLFISYIYNIIIYDMGKKNIYG